MARAKFSDDQCLEFARRTQGENRSTVAELAEEYGVSYSTMCKYVNIGKHMQRDISILKRELSDSIAEKMARYYFQTKFCTKYFGGSDWELTRIIAELLQNTCELEELRSDKIEAIFEKKLLDFDCKTIHYRYRQGVAMFVMWFQMTHRKESVI